jgi:sugar phosphate isomerase/epimerase
MELTCSYLTLAGCGHEGKPMHALDTRAYAALMAGFSSIGAGPSDTNLDPHVLKNMQALGQVTELEWFEMGDPNWAELNELFQFADKLGTVNCLKVGVCKSDRNGSEAEVLRTVAKRAADHGIRVTVEPVAWGAFPTIDDVLNLMNEAGGRNMGLLYDTWQVYYHERKLPIVDPELISSIEISGTREGQAPSTNREQILAQAMNRTWPNAGIDTADIRSFLSSTIELGYRGPIGVEVPTEVFTEGRETVTDEAYSAHNSLAAVICDACS